MAMTLDEHIDHVFRDYFADGIPASGTVDVSFPELRTLLARMAEINLASKQCFTRWDNTQRVTYKNVATTMRTLTADNLYFMQLPIGASGTALRIGVEVTTEIAASSARLGIYENHYGRAQPGVLILDAGTVATATTGFKEIVISQAMTPGLYWLAILPSGGITVRTIQTTMPWPMVNGLANSRTVSVSRAFAFAALPTDERASNMTWATASPPHLWLGG